MVLKIGERRHTFKVLTTSGAPEEGMLEDVDALLATTIATEVRTRVTLERESNNGIR